MMVKPLKIEIRSVAAPMTAVALAGLSLAGCATTDPKFEAEWQKAGHPEQSASAAPGAPVIGRYKLGAPYEAGGLWYVPADQPNYEETGVASWYGAGFDGKTTSNGERFDINIPSAAHATLPMPSIVEVTNLENGKKLQVRLNDRGPYKPGRIIDLSPAAARELGFYEKGSAKVHIRYVGVASLDPRDNQPVTARNDRAPPAAQPDEAPAAKPAAIKSAPIEQAAPPSSTPLKALVDGYVVQAGAFSDKARAERVASAISQTGPAEIRPLERNGATLYRVVVGAWRDPKTAQAIRETVASLGYTDAKVVKAF